MNSHGNSVDPDRLKKPADLDGLLFSIVYVWLHSVFKSVYCFKHSEGFAQNFVHYLFLIYMGQVKLSMDKYLMAIYLSLAKY